YGQFRATRGRVRGTRDSSHRCIGSRNSTALRRGGGEPHREDRARRRRRAHGGSEARALPRRGVRRVPEGRPPAAPSGRPSPRLRRQPRSGDIDSLFEASSRSFTFWIFPEPVIGKSSTNMTRRGILKLAIRPRQYARTSFSVTTWPGSQRTNATPTSLSRASG